MELLFTPANLVALLTLVLLEVVLGIDNLVFIAILTDKLPPESRDKARRVGLLLALVMRLGLLVAISWLAGLIRPLFTVFGHGFSGRDLILLCGGLFLLFKATTELHERLEGRSHLDGPRAYVGFWLVVLQIVVLDAVFSLDSVITAVGMVEHLSIMMLAVVIAIGIMLLASKPLMRFVGAHPTVVVLCLSFLLLIGLSLIAEGMGFHLPKGYLYAAIGFSVLIEFFNQVAQRNIRRHEARKPLRLRTAEAVMNLLGGRRKPDAEEQGLGNDKLFAAEEVDMVNRVLTLSDRTVRSIMTPRADVRFINLEDSLENIRQFLLDSPPTTLPVCLDARLDTILGVASSAELLGDLVIRGEIDQDGLKEPLIVPESTRISKLLEILRSRHAPLIFVTDEYGSIEGLITYMDVFEAIAGDISEEGESPPLEELPEGRWRVTGVADVHFLEHYFGITGLISPSNDYTSLAGFILARLGRLPEPGDSVEFAGLRFTVENMADRRITEVLVERAQP